MILQSQVKASLTIHDAWLDLQDGSVHDGKPTSALFPLIVPPASRAGILFGTFFKKIFKKNDILILILFDMDLWFCR